MHGCLLHSCNWELFLYLQRIFASGLFLSICGILTFFLQYAYFWSRWLMIKFKTLRESLCHRHVNKLKSTLLTYSNKLGIDKCLEYNYKVASWTHVVENSFFEVVSLFKVHSNWMIVTALTLLSKFDVDCKQMIDGMYIRAQWECQNENFETPHLFSIVKLNFNVGLFSCIFLFEAIFIRKSAIFCWSLFTREKGPK